MKEMVIEKMECTCSACPTQYDIYLKDGRNIYFRYRFGSLRIELEGKVIYTWNSEDRWDGSLELHEVVSHLAKAGIFAFD